MCTICHNIICPSGCPNCHEHSEADEFSGISAGSYENCGSCDSYENCGSYGSYGSYDSYDSYDSYGRSGEVMAVCDSCGEPLYVGDRATIIEDYIFCERCIEDATVTLTPQGSAYND